MKAQHFVHKPMPIKAFQATESFRNHLATLVPKDSVEPLKIIFDGIETGAVFYPETKEIMVPRGKGLTNKLLNDRWFVYEKHGKAVHDIFADERDFHQLYEPAGVNAGRA